MIKNSEDIKGMRVAGKLAAQTLEMIGEHVKPCLLYTSDAADES